MPYNTRRKSLSLPSLGIHVPSSHPRTNRHSISNSNTNTSRMASSRSASDSSNNNSGEHPNKRVKRTHTPAAKLNQTPPHSPGVQDSIEKDDSASLETKTIDLDAVNDEIVQAVIVRLQETSNRPHLVKDLSTALMGQVKVVQQ